MDKSCKMDEEKSEAALTPLASRCLPHWVVLLFHPELGHDSLSVIFFSNGSRSFNKKLWNTFKKYLQEILQPRSLNPSADDTHNSSRTQHDKWQWAGWGSTTVRPTRKNIGQSGQLCLNITTVKMCIFGQWKLNGTSQSAQRPGTRHSENCPDRSL